MNAPTKPLSNPAKTETLSYIGVARKAAHGADGVRYRHAWPTGWQVLIFESHSQAAKWINPLGSTQSIS